jgi:hypothetical protein
MSTLDPLLEIVQSSRGEIQLIGDFASEVDALLESKRTQKPPEPFTPSETEELRKLGAAFMALGTASRSQSSKRPKTVYQTQMSPRVGAFVLQTALPIKKQSFLSEMALVYLVSKMESFIKDYTLELLLLRPSMLRSGASMAYEEMLSYNSMKALRRAIAQREVDALGYGSVDDVATYYQKKLNIEFSKFPGWLALREQTYRRNLIVHNKGRVNDLYRKKVQVSSGGSHVRTDMPYVESAVENILGFIEFFHQSVHQKFNRTT